MRRLCTERSTSYPLIALVTARRLKEAIYKAVTVYHLDFKAPNHTLPAGNNRPPRRPPRPNFRAYIRLYSMSYSRSTYSASNSPPPPIDSHPAPARPWTSSKPHGSSGFLGMTGAGTNKAEGVRFPKASPPRRGHHLAPSPASCSPSATSATVSPARE